MERYLPIGIATILFIISGLLIANHTLYSKTPFSPQATIDPETITESFDPNVKTAVYDNAGVAIPEDVTHTIASEPPERMVLGARTGGNKRIEVDLTNQRLYAYEGTRKVFDFLVSTGKWGRTPTGIFHIWIKLRSTKMEGGSKDLGTYYYLPNVPYTMFFYNDEVPQWRGYGIHGTYWHDNFGTPMSHGCVNMKTEEVEKLYYWANPELGGSGSIRESQDNPGTPVIIYGTAPAV